MLTPQEEIALNLQGFTAHENFVGAVAKGMGSIADAVTSKNSKDVAKLEAESKGRQTVSNNRKSLIESVLNYRLQQKIIKQEGKKPKDQNNWMPAVFICLVGLLAGAVILKRTNRI